MRGLTQAMASCALGVDFEASLGRLGNVLCRHEGCDDFFILASKAAPDSLQIPIAVTVTSNPQPVQLCWAPAHPPAPDGSAPRQAVTKVLPQQMRSWRREGVDLQTSKHTLCTQVFVDLCVHICPHALHNTTQHNTTQDNTTEQTTTEQSIAYHAGTEQDTA